MARNKTKPRQIDSIKEVCDAIDMIGYKDKDVFASAVFAFKSLPVEEQVKWLDSYRVYLKENKEKSIKNKKSVQTDTETRKKISSIKLQNVNSKTKIATIIYWFMKLPYEKRKELIMSYLETHHEQ